jgi:hypothetical protein
MTDKGPYRTEAAPKAMPGKWRQSTRLLISAYLLAWFAALLHLAKMGISADRLLNLGTIATSVHALALGVLGMWQRDNENTDDNLRRINSEDWDGEQDERVEEVEE